MKSFSGAIQKLKEIKRLNKKLKIIDIVNSCLVVVCVICTLQIDMAITEPSAVLNTLRSVNMLACLAISLALAFRYKYSYLGNNLQLGLCPEEGLFKLDTSGYLSFFFEVAFNTIFTPPVVSATYNGSMMGGEYLFRFDQLSATFALVKTYHFIRLYSHFS